jgi:pimeloyl-ACP methyl ester carboxylesterase
MTHTEQHLGPHGTVNGTPVWLRLGSEPLYAVLHEPTNLSRPDTAVLLLPNFGWDESCSYRARREWAIALAKAGFMTVRIDLPGSEDSTGSPLASARATSWVDAVGEVAGWLRDSSGSSRVAVIGIGLGGLLAIEATSLGAPIDDLILWAVPASGRAYLRQLRMYARSIMGVHSRDATKSERPDGAVGLAGHLMSAETAAAISAIDVGELSLPADRAHHVLLIDRDEHGVDEQLRQQLSDAGASITVAASADYGQMMTWPDLSKAPLASIERSISWLNDRAATGEEGLSPMDSEFVTDAISFDYDGHSITERQIALDGPSGRLVGILSEPESGEPPPFCVVSVNSGPLRRTSPSRMWTELCRRCAAHGIPALRFDFDGIGDSEGEYISRTDRTDLDERRITSDQLAFHDYLQQHGVADSFATIGLCAGARRELRVALEDSRVVGSILINPVAVEWTPEQAHDRARRHALAPLREGLVGRLRSNGLPSIAGVGRTIRALGDTAWGVGSAAAQSQLKPLNDAFDKFEDANTSVLFLFSQNEALYDQLRGLGVLETLDTWPSVRVEELATSDHQLRPLTVQEFVQARIDQFLTELRARHSARPPMPTRFAA